jgi:hypothetical protein
MNQTITLIFDFLNKVTIAISPIIMGSGLRPLLFQAFTILIPSISSVYSMINAKSSSVIILSHNRMRLATFLIGAFYLGCHQLLLHLTPANPSWWGRIGFVVLVYILMVIIPFNVGNLITYLLNKIGDGPYVVLVEEQAGRGDDFWTPGPNFVRRVVARYYLNGLLLPYILLFLFSGNIQFQWLALLMLLVGTVFLLLMLCFRDPRFLPVFSGYLILAYLASNYSVYKW